MELFKILQDIVNLDSQHIEEIGALIDIKNFKKNETFLKKGAPCTTIGFVIEGSFRFVIDSNGNERTFDFSVKNDFLSDYYGILKSQPASFDIIANHSSKVALLPTAVVFELFDKDMTYQKIGRTIAENEFCKHHERLTSLMYDSPQKRYEGLLATMPDSALRLPQHLLANYLGITKETLSRIRSKIVR